MKNIKLLFIAFLVIFMGCQKDFDGDDKTIETKNNRVTLKNQRVPLVPGFGMKSQPGDPVIMYEFTLVAEVDAPTIDGQIVQATHVEIFGNRAFVSYNMRGSQNLGAIDIIDITNPESPFIISTIEFDNKDINTIGRNNDLIWFAGQYAEGAFIGSYDQINDIMNINDLPSFSAMSMDIKDNMIYVVSGDTGGLTVIDETGEDTFTSFSDARSVVADDEVYVLTSSGIFTLNGFDTGIDPNYLQNGSKADLDVSDYYLFAALNRGGVYIYDKSDLSVLQTLDRPLNQEGSNDEDFVTNSVSFNGLLFIADGGAGIRVAGESENTFVEYGYFDFGGPLSSNFVKSKNEFVFVASGLGGLKILTFEEIIIPPVEPGEYCETLADDIIEMFPETEDATIAHPYLFDGENELRIITNKQTDVWIQFIWEGAGWTNTFGYYTYELGNEPQSVNDIEKNVIFPNASMAGSGGNLNQGDMVFLGNFPANTVIGFYLTAKGWQNGQIVNGIYTHYTDYHLNDNAMQQHLLFLENCCNELVLTFEDILLPGGDLDFNDIIFTIKDNNEGYVNLPESFKEENIYFIPLCDGDETDCTWINETAFAGSDAGGGAAWWYYIDNTSKSQHPIYAGQELVEGAYVEINPVNGTENVELIIELGSNMILQDVSEAVKIQGYCDGHLPASRPPAGQFTTYKGNELSVEIPNYDYYVVHLDVKVCK